MVGWIGGDQCCQEFELLSKYLNMKYFSFLSLKTPLISGCIGAPRM